MLNNLPTWLRQHIAALRILLVFSVIFGIGYPLVILAIAQIPGLQSKADGSMVSAGGRAVGSSLIGQSFTDNKGDPIAKYFQSRPSEAGDGYDPTSTGASNLGPEDIVDKPSDPSLLTQVCARSKEVGEENGVDGQRPYCTSTGVGSVLSVIHTHGTVGKVIEVVSVDQPCPATPFISTYDGVPVTCAAKGKSYSIGKIVPVRGPGKSWPANPVPPDAVTASGSGLDPDISVAYADLQAKRVASVRGLSLTRVDQLIKTYTTGRTLGFIGEPSVNVLELNLALDRDA